MTKHIDKDSGLPSDFDPEAYLLLNPDVRMAGMDPVHHYLQHGRKENREYKKRHAVPVSKDATLRKRHHSIISGTGRAGTSFLVQLLTHLGVDTGYGVRDLATQIDKRSKAGFEHDVRSENAPYLVKNPFFCEYADEVIRNDRIVIDRIFIPYRDMREAVLSRVRVSSEADHESKSINGIPGGLWNTKRPEDQQDILYSQLNKLLDAVAKTEIPVILMSFPKLVEDPEYCYRKLLPLIPSVEFDFFKTKFHEVSRPEWVHKFNDHRVSET